MALPTVTVETRIKVNLDGEVHEVTDQWDTANAVAVINHQVVSVTNAYENLPMGEVDPDYAILYVKNHGTAGSILLTYDTLKPAGFGYVRNGESQLFRLPDISTLVIEMIAVNNVGPHRVEVFVIDGADDS